MQIPLDESNRLLIEAAVAGQLSAADQPRLEELLRASPRYRQLYLDCMSVHLDLDLLSRQEEEFPLVLPATPQPESRRRTGLPLRWALICLPLLMLLIWWGQPWGTSPSSPTVVEQIPPANSPDGNHNASSANGLPRRAPLRAQVPPVVEEVAQARFFREGLSPDLGQELYFDREYVLTEGIIAFRFDKGTRVVLEAPSIFQIPAPDRLHLRSGLASVHVPPAATGFVLTSPTAEILDLGTRFAVDVAETGETSLHVVEGTVTIRPREDPAPAASSSSTNPPLVPDLEQTLHTGEQVRVDAELQIQAIPITEPLVHYRQHLPDRVIRYEATTDQFGMADELLNVLVQRGGKMYRYTREQFIRAQLTHFEITENKAAFCIPFDFEFPVGRQRLSFLESDWRLSTGIINPLPVTPRDPEKPVMSLKFNEPIVNGPGPDILIFDLQVYVSRSAGDIVLIRSGDDRPHRPEHEYRQFDIDLSSQFALDLVPHKTIRSDDPVRSLQDLIDNEFYHGHQVNLDAKGLVLGVDLTDLGYAPGETLTQLDFMPVQSRDVFDPVLILGLPAPKPSQKTSDGIPNKK